MYMYSDEKASTCCCTCLLLLLLHKRNCAAINTEKPMNDNTHRSQPKPCALPP